MFDDNNFEAQFVDTTNDHDTLPLNQAVAFEDDHSAAQKSSSTDSDIAQIASLVGADVHASKSDGSDEVVDALSEPAIKNTLKDADKADTANVRDTSSTSSSEDSSPIEQPSAEPASTDIEESVTEQAAKAKKVEAEEEDESESDTEQATKAKKKKNTAADQEMEALKAKQ